MAGQLILSLSILVVLHEMGHFLPAKWFGTKVEKFYLFFDPWFEIFKFDYKGTEYGVGWLPLGGYVKIAGMMDESFDTEQLEQEPQDWEFRSKPAWQRLIIMVGGVTVNFILGFLIFTGIMWYWGEEYIPIESAKYGIVTDSLGRELGLVDGDQVLAVGDKQLDKVSAGEVRLEIIINNARSIEVERNGSKQTLTVSDELAQQLSSSDNTGSFLFQPRTPFIVDKEFPDESPAKEKGIQPNDKIIALNGQPTPYFHDFSMQIRKDSRKILDEFEENKEKGIMAWLKSLFGKAEKANLQRVVKVDVERGVASTKDTLSFDIETTADRGLIGAGPIPFETAYKKYSFTQAIPAGYNKSVDFLSNQIKAFGKMFSGEIKAQDSLGSFFTIGKQFGGTWIWERFWILTASLSLILGFINLLPIPMLDGGHVMFLLYEIIAGRKPNEKFQEYASYVGFVLLIGLMIFAVGLDIWRNFIK